MKVFLRKTDVCILRGLLLTRTSEKADLLFTSFYVVLSMKSFSKMFFNFLLNSCSVLLNLSKGCLYSPVVEGSLSSCRLKRKESEVSVNFLWCASKRLSI